jgi:hypothetical protein
MIEVPRHIKVKPSPSKQLSLHPIDVWNGDEQDAIGREPAAKAPESAQGIAQVLQAVPECDAIEYGCVWNLAQIRDNIQAALPSCLRIEFRSLDLPAAFSSRKQKAAVAAANIKQHSRLLRTRRVTYD